MSKYWLGLFVLFFLVWTVVHAPSGVLPPSFVEKSPEIKLTFVGDIMLDRGVRDSVLKNGAGDFDWLFQDVGDLAKSDILFANLEGPVSDQGEDLHHLYSFRMSPAVVPALARAGFDILSIANNHIGDWGQVAADDTARRLQAAGITPVSSDLKIIQKNNLTIGWLAFSDVGSGWLTVSDEKMMGKIEAAAWQVDVLVVSLHFGEEYRTSATARQRELARLAIDSGARIVVGHHPHVIEEIERYRGGLIAYSLGNFIFDQYFSLETMRGLVLDVILNKSEILAAQTRISTLDSSFRPHLSLESQDV